MKALIIESSGHLVLKDIPVPEYGPNEVLVKIAACGICMSDLEAIDGIRPEPYINALSWCRYFSLWCRQYSYSRKG